MGDVKLRGAISGFGQVAARGHLPGWRTREDAAIVATHEPLAQRRHEALRLLKNVRVYDDLGLMLDGEAPDFVDIASPPATHADAARAALEAGAHVLVEKPICLSLAEFDDLVAFASDRSRILMCVHNWKFAPPYVAARDAILAGHLGRVRELALDRLRTEPAGAGGAGAMWRAAAKTGGGILIDHGWHVFYLMRWLMGGASPTDVSARLESRADHAEDAAELRLTFPNAIATAHLSWRAPARRTSALIRGDRATLEIDGDRVTLTAHATPAVDLSLPDAPDDSYHAAWFAGVADHFLRAIAGRADATENLAEARDALTIIDAARCSTQAGGKSIRIHSPD